MHYLARPYCSLIVKCVRITTDFRFSETYFPPSSSRQQPATSKSMLRPFCQSSLSSPLAALMFIINPPGPALPRGRIKDGFVELTQNPPPFAKQSIMCHMFGTLFCFFPVPAPTRTIFGCLRKRNDVSPQISLYQRQCNAAN